MIVKKVDDLLDVLGQHVFVVFSVFIHADLQDVEKDLLEIGLLIRLTMLKKVETRFYETFDE